MEFSQLFILCLLVVPINSFAVEYNCTVTKKISQEYEYNKQELANGKFSVVIKENKNKAYLSRCSHSYAEDKVTCDHYSVDKIVSDDIHTTKGDINHIKKFYVFRGQFDVQLYPDLSFIENNGRGDISFGKCLLTSP